MVVHVKGVSGVTPVNVRLNEMLNHVQLIISTGSAVAPSEFNIPRLGKHQVNGMQPMSKPEQNSVTLLQLILATTSHRRYDFY